MDPLAPLSLTIFEASELHHAWQQASSETVTVDLSQVAEVDAAGLQLLLYWHGSAQSQLHFSQPSDVILQSSGILNLSDTLWPQEASDE